MCSACCFHSSTLPLFPNQLVDHRKSTALPGYQKPPLILADPSAGDHTTAQLAEEYYDDTQECIQNVRTLEQRRPGSPTDSGFGSRGPSDDGVIRHMMPMIAIKNPTNLSIPGICSVGSSPFTSPGTSADGTFIRLNKYKWVLVWCALYM